VAYRTQVVIPADGERDSSALRTAAVGLPWEIELLLRKNLRQTVLVESGVIAAHIGVTAITDVGLAGRLAHDRQVALPTWTASVATRVETGLAIL
jgi:hypothetical protein